MTVENWFLYPNCMWKGVRLNPGYAVYQGWDNNAANVSLIQCFDFSESADLVALLRSKAVKTSVLRSRLVKSNATTLPRKLFISTWMNIC